MLTPIAAILLTIAPWATPVMSAGARPEAVFASSNSTFSNWARDPREVDEWATRALADPNSDRGWNQTAHNGWDEGWVSICIVRELPYPRDGKPIAFDGGSYGGISVVGWDRDQVRLLYRIVARARTEERANEIAQAIRVVRSGGKLQSDGPETKNGESYSVDLRIWVPHSSDLSMRIETGPMGIENVRGTMDLVSISGPVSLVDLAGAVQARLESGPLRVALAGSRWDGAGLDAAVESGPVNLILPKNYSAHLETGTNSGPSSIGDAFVTQGLRGGYIVAKLGSGGPPVRVVTDSGPFHMASR